MIYTVVHIIPWVLLNFKGTMSETFKQNKVNKLEGTCWRTSYRVTTPFFIHGI